jgi:hypothetical protein
MIPQERSAEREAQRETTDPKRQRSALCAMRSASGSMVKFGFSDFLMVGEKEKGR